MSRGLILQYDSRGVQYPEFLDYNISYAKSKNYKFLFLLKSIYYVPPYWEKIFIVKDFLPFYSWILWLDSDAVIYNMDMEIPGLELPYDFIFTSDPPCWRSPFNAGVFLVKNTPVGIKILNEWISGYNPKRWYLKNSKWYCYGEWSGVDYEQGFFVKNIMQKYKDNIKSLEWYVYNTPCYHYIHPKTFSIHFAASFKNDIKDIIEGNLGKCKSGVESS